MADFSKFNQKNIQGMPDAFFEIKENDWGVLLEIKKLPFWKEILSFFFPLHFEREYVLKNCKTDAIVTVKRMSRQWTKANIGWKVLYQ